MAKKKEPEVLVIDLADLCDCKCHKNKTYSCHCLDCRCRDFGCHH